ncbi:hypothetical protein [Hymenobacter perfusus]|uniref:Uncharacterized protein n=1 Tax=Hymenobacter perfusus TaxID=1236770 RepID=A0A3R9P5F6_9BACT|nr:hypothetical protein [Hymenobacter perfusus]RSK44688.1 hypothetical protein EI293_09260 [Hymenobacter perfusus]
MPKLPPFLYRVLGLLLLLALVLFVLKAAGHLALSWWWATAPLWAPWLLALAAAVLLLSVSLLLRTVRR